MEVQKVLNNNTPNQLSPAYTDTSNCGRLGPDKFTFLKSNQLITPYVKKGNVLRNPMTSVGSPENNVDAYDLCQSELQVYEQQLRNKLAKIEHISNQARLNSHLHQRELEKEQRELEQQAKKIELMIEATYAKAGDIMYGRNNSTYSRKNNDATEIPLKDMKQTTCDRSAKKVEATKKLMLSKSHTYLQNVKPTADASYEAAVSRDTSYSSNSSLLSNSVMSTELNHQRDKTEKEKSIKKLLKNYSYQDLFNAKRREAADDGFAMFWQIGNTDKKVNKTSLFNDEQRVRKTGLKKSKRPDYKQSLLQEIRENQKCDLAATRAYSEAFNNQIKQFAITEKC